MNGKTLTLNDIDLENFGLPGIMVVECEVNIEIDNANDWYVDVVMLGGKRAPELIAKAIEKAIYDNEAICGHIGYEVRH
jgi:hypothetical protein